MRIVMVGTGYVGLVSGVCFADFGHDVVCVDKNLEKIEMLKSSKIPIFEPGLDLLIEKNIKAKRLSFSSELETEMRDAEAIFIAVGTPSRRGDGHADLTYVYAAAEEIAVNLKRSSAPFVAVVIKSTVPVGTGDAVEKIISKHVDTSKFAVVSNPEFLREGSAIFDFKQPNRIIVGVEQDVAKPIMTSIYNPLLASETPILFTNRPTSELIKYASNAFLATKITFINEIADISEKVGANIQEVSRGIGLDKRIGAKFLDAGPGYGGSCFPKDTIALSRIAEEAGAPATIVDAVIKANESRKTNMAHKVIEAMGGDLQGKKVAVLGLAFKPNTDDMRSAPSLTIVPKLQSVGASVTVYDPEAMSEAKKHLQDIEYTADPYSCAAGADVLVVITEWDEFRALDLNRLKSTMRSPNVVDLRNIYSEKDMKAKGLKYFNIGNPPV